MASTSSPSFSFSKFEFPVSNPRGRNYKIASSISFRENHISKPTISSPKPRFSLIDSHQRRLVSSLNAALIDPIEDKSVSDTGSTTNNPEFEVLSCTWNWRDYSIRYQFSGNSGPALVLVHGFGANSDHWRKNIPVLAKSHRVYAIDLIGYGYSDKPNPREFGVNSFYTFETWATQLNEFCTNVIKDEAFFICNSIGGLVGLQAAVMEPQICKGIVLLNISLRMLHIKKQPWFGRPFIRSFQSLLRNTAVGKFFFKTVATPQSVKSILCQCYHDTSQVTEELVEKILLPGLEPGAVDVFLEFICYSEGPLPEELLPQVKCPVLVAWGDKDPWEPIDLGRVYGEFDVVEDFVVLSDVGHCPQDEAPHLVNPLVESFVARHASAKASASMRTV
ncbi:Alpha/beta hydrolase fold-1 [Macleaya cordata]|uniref:Alpha/beta hydrolase fold-1 n=1 Tax=Macleaya cordata TaxID=56857 RepID=A0A200RA73_MACCD|nr:Alpha/beta hydrolase fold-1 [Macleaya cordata]